MTSSQPYDRPAWRDRFQQPTVRRLRDALSPNGRHVFEAVRKHLMQLDGVDEHLAWYGDGWHWAVEYHTPLSDEPLAVLIPCPSDLQLALPMDREFVNSLLAKRLKRAIRDGLELARDPFDTRWGVWSIAGTQMVDDLQDLIELRLNHLAKRAG